MKVFNVSVYTSIDISVPDSTTPEQAEALANSAWKYLSCDIDPSFEKDNPGCSAVASDELNDYQDFTLSPAPEGILHD